MLHHLLLLTLLSLSQGFTLDATAHHEVDLPLPADSVRSLVGRISTLETMMPGVVDITAQSGGWFLYRTEREIPFSGKMQTDFRIVSMRGEDGSVTYRTPGTEAENWMSFRLAPAATGNGKPLFLRSSPARRSQHVSMLAPSGEASQKSRKIPVPCCSLCGRSSTITPPAQSQSEYSRCTSYICTSKMIR